MSRFIEVYASGSAFKLILVLLGNCRLSLRAGFATLVKQEKSKICSTFTHLKMYVYVRVSSAELRRDVTGSRYVSALCGLGSTARGEPHFPEHDILVNIDADLSVHDIGLVTTHYLLKQSQ